MVRQIQRIRVNWSRSPGAEPLLLEPVVGSENLNCNWQNAGRSVSMNLREKNSRGAMSWWGVSTISWVLSPGGLPGSHCEDRRKTPTPFSSGERKSGHCEIHPEHSVLNEAWCRDWNMRPQIHVLKSKLPVPHKVTLFGNRVSENVIKLGRGTPIQYDQCP